MTDSSAIVVWQADYDPFGKATVNDDPDGNGVHVINNIRFPGQYFDAETGLHYNYHRYYDPGIGRYVSPDPIGFDGGLNTYTYVENRPTVFTDPLGLKTLQCTKPLNAMGGSGAKSGPDIWGNTLYHQYSCVVRGGKVICGGQDRGENGAGKPSNDSMGAGQCKETEPDNNCFEKCLVDEWAKPRPKYGIIPFGTDCQEYDDDVNQRCRKQCNKK